MDVPVLKVTALGQVGYGNILVMAAVRTGWNILVMAAVRAGWNISVMAAVRTQWNILVMAAVRTGWNILVMAAVRTGRPYRARRLSARSGNAARRPALCLTIQQITAAAIVIACSTNAPEKP